jgi:site-specific DNA-methyltransferase (adenine-specific)
VLGEPGIEIEPGYFEIACKRVEEAHREPDLFREEPRQLSLFGLFHT